MELNLKILAPLLQYTSIDRFALFMRAKKKNYILFYLLRLNKIIPLAFLFHSFIRASLSLSHSLSSHLWLWTEAHYLSQFILLTPVSPVIKLWYLNSDILNHSLNQPNYFVKNPYLASLSLSLNYSSHSIFQLSSHLSKLSQCCALAVRLWLCFGLMDLSGFPHLHSTARSWLCFSVRWYRGWDQCVVSTFG